MAKKRQGRAAPGKAVRGAGDATAAIATGILCLVLAGTALAVDTGAGAAFDSPKRLIAVVGTALAAACLLVGGRRIAPQSFRRLPTLSRASVLLACAALGLAVVSALASPRRTIALDSLRTIAILALLVPLGASRIFPKARGPFAAVLLGAAAINSVVAVLEARGLYSPFQLETFGSRQETGAFAGNVGYLAIVLSLAAVVALGILLTNRRAPIRAASAACLVLAAAGLVVNQNLTALMSVLAGSAVLLVLRFRSRAAIPIAAAVLAILVAVFAYPPLRHRANQLYAAAAIGNWDALVSFRGGPWAAAVQMTRERPLLGYGPGTFGAEYIPHRLAAEIRTRRRFVSPLVTSSYAESHNDYLQVASDAGIPAALLAIGAGVALFAAIGRAAWRRGRPEAIVLAAVLATGAAAALTWFPFQRPITIVPLLLAAGRAWRLAATSDEDDRGEDEAAT